MEITAFQLIKMLILLAFAGAAYWAASRKCWKILGVITFVAFAAMFVSPVWMVEKSGSDLEFNVDRFSDIPAKVEVENKEFQDRQNEELNSLKQQSEEIIK